MAKLHARPSNQYRYEHYDPWNIDRMTWLSLELSVLPDQLSVIRLDRTARRAVGAG